MSEEITKQLDEAYREYAEKRNFMVDGPDGKCVVTASHVPQMDVGEHQSVPVDEQQQIIEFKDLEVRAKVEQLFRMVWYNGFCDMNALQSARHYMETIAECAREFPVIVDYKPESWVLEWQMTDRVRKLNFEFSRINAGLGNIRACSTTKDNEVFITAPMRMTGENIRFAFRWYYTKEHVLWIDKAQSDSAS